MAMGNPSRASQAPGGTRGANQALIVVFERDESLAGLLLGQLRAQGYEGRSAKTPVEVFDLIARYPVRLTLVNLGQPATSRREFWVALDAQRFGRGVQVITYRYSVPGVDSDLPDGSGRPDVEVRGPQGISTLIDAVRSKLPPPAREIPDSSFLVGSRMPGLSPNDQPSPAPKPPAPVMSSFGNAPENVARQLSISGILNLSRGMPPGQAPEFMPMSASSGAPAMNSAPPGWMPEINRMPPTPERPPMNGFDDQRAPQWPNGRAEPPAMPAAAAAPSWPNAAPRPEAPGNSQMNGVPFNPSMPMGDLAALSDAINALAAAGAPGYQRAAAAANALQGTPLPINERGDRWNGGQGQAVEERTARPASAGSTYPVAPPPSMPEERYPGASMGGMNQSNHGGQPAPRSAAETLYMGQQAFTELGRAEGTQQQQDTRSRSLAGSIEEYDYPPRASTIQGNGDQPSAAPSRRLADEREPMAGGGHATHYQNQNQMLAPVVSNGQVERSLSNVLVEGQLVSPQRLEVAMGIQRLLRGVDLDYRLGEVLLTFKFLTHDQLLAAVLVSRGLVSPAQVASIGRIKQELHAIGMEYDLENLLILFRMLSSEQLREIRSEFP